MLGVAPAFVPVALAFGSAIHAALASHYQAIQAGTLLPLEALVAIFRSAWDGAATGPVPLQLDDDGGVDPVDRGVAMLRAFYGRAPAVVDVESVERSMMMQKRPHRWLM